MKRGKTSIEDRLQSVEDRFIEDGFDFEFPYLNLGSLDQFEFVPRPGRGPALDTAPGARTSEECLKAAAEIGRTLAQQAAWHDNRCNWIGAELAARPPRKELPLQYSIQDIGAGPVCWDQRHRLIHGGAGGANWRFGGAPDRFWRYQARARLF